MLGNVSPTGCMSTDRLSTERRSAFSSRFSVLIFYYVVFVQCTCSLLLHRFPVYVRPRARAVIYSDAASVVRLAASLFRLGGRMRACGRCCYRGFRSKEDGSSVLGLCCQVLGRHVLVPTLLRGECLVSGLRSCVRIPVCRFALTPCYQCARLRCMGSRCFCFRWYRTCGCALLEFDPPYVQEFCWWHFDIPVRHSGGGCLIRG
jgi:hypothetical protein